MRTPDGERLEVKARIDEHAIELPRGKLTHHEAVIGIANRNGMTYAKHVPARQAKHLKTAKRKSRAHPHLRCVSFVTTTTLWPCRTSSEARLSVKRLTPPMLGKHKAEKIAIVDKMPPGPQFNTMRKMHGRISISTRLAYHELNGKCGRSRTPEELGTLSTLVVFPLRTRKHA